MYRDIVVMFLSYVVDTFVRRIGGITLSVNFEEILSTIDSARRQQYFRFFFFPLLQIIISKWYFVYARTHLFGYESRENVRSSWYRRDARQAPGSLGVCFHDQPSLFDPDLYIECNVRHIEIHRDGIVNMMPFELHRVNSSRLWLRSLRSRVA